MMHLATDRQQIILVLMQVKKKNLSLNLKKKVYPRLGYILKFERKW